MSFKHSRATQVFIMVGVCIAMTACKIVDTSVDEQTENIDENNLIIAVMGNYTDSKDPFARGATMAANEVNAAGGIDGRKISLVFRNSGCSTSKAEYEAQKIIIKYPSLIAVAGPECSGAGAAINAELGSQGIPIVAFTTSSPTLTAVDNFFRLQSSDAIIVGSFSDAILAQQAEFTDGNYQSDGIIKLGIVYNEDDYTTGLATGIKSAFEAETVTGLTLEVSEFIEFSDGEAGFSDEIAELDAITHNLDVIAFMGFKDDIANFSQGLAGTSGYDVDTPIYVPNLKDTVLEESSDSILVNMRALTPNGALDASVFPNLSAFLADFNAQWNMSETEEDAAQGYDALMLIALSLLQADSDGDIDVNTDSSAAIRVGILANMIDVSRGTADFENSEANTLYIEPGEFSDAVTAFNANSTDDLNYNGASGYIDFDAAGDINYGAYFIQKAVLNTSTGLYEAVNLTADPACYGPIACSTP